MEVRIVNPDAEGIGEVAVRSKTVMSHYLDDPEMTAETIVDGWLMTGDLGPHGRDRPLAALRPQEKHDRHRRRQEYLSRGYRNDISKACRVKEFCVFAANYLWPARTMVGEKLVLVLHPEPGKPITAEMVADITERNRRLLNYKRISGYLVWERDFPLTASLKIKRGELAEQIRAERSARSRGAACDPCDDLHLPEVSRP